MGLSHAKIGQQKRDIRRESRSRDDSVHAGRADYVTYYADFVTPSKYAMGHEMSEQVEAAFDRLSERHREIITLHRIAGLSHKEVGERMGLKENACRALLRRALLALSCELAADTVGEDD